MEREQYSPVMQTETRQLGGGAQNNEIPPRPPSKKPSFRENLISRFSTRSKRTDIVPFVCYGLALLFVFFASLGFWIHGRRQPIYFSQARTRWMFANPKTTTILWTAIAAIISWCTLWLYSCSVSLMARKLIIHGAKISTIESWVKLSSHGTMLDRHRPFLSLFTGLSAITAALLTVGFAGLLTPITMVRVNQLNATELNITEDVFHDWYADTTNRTVVGCQWYTYTNNRTGNHYTLPTCQFQDDTALVLQAGRAAVEQGFGLKTVTKIGDVNFNGTTGGTLPVGINGFQAFDDLVYDLDEEFPPVYNYSTILQGSTIEVTCQENNTSPITEQILGHIPTKRGETFRDNMHVRYSFNGSESGGRCQWDYNFEFMVPGGGNLMSFMCGPNESKEYFLFFRPFGEYASGDRGLQLQNITCKVEPRMTLNNVTYSSITNDFTSKVIQVYETPAMSPTDAEAIDAVFQVFWYGISIHGNFVADTIVSLRHQNQQDNGQALSETFENILKGFYEIEMTSLRLYYSANSAPGMRNVTGSLTHFRMGYNGTPEALYALVPFAIIVILALSYLIYGLSVGGHLFEFNPTRTTSLLVASSQGGLDLGEKIKASSEGYPDETSVQDVKVRFGELPHGVLGLRMDEPVIRTSEVHETATGSPA